MKTIIIFLSSLLVSLVTTSQERFFTKNGKIVFFSKAPLEDIEATNRSVTCVLDKQAGKIQFAVLMKGFEFEKARMQEHFNENYLESHKYPKAEFKGQIVNNGEIDYTKDGSYPASVRGNLTIHGETKKVEAGGIIHIKGGKISANSEFSILVSDYKIAIPRLVKDNISNNVKIRVDLTLEPLKG